MCSFHIKNHFTVRAVKYIKPLLILATEILAMLKGPP